MSYARSPRPLCSITIGTRPRPCGSIMRCLVDVKGGWNEPLPPRFRKRTQAALASGGAHQLGEGGGLVLDLDFREHPVDHVALDRRGLELAQALVLLVMPAHHGLGLLVSLCGLGDQRLDLFGARA